MATFDLIARHQMVLGNGIVVAKGSPVTLNIHIQGITPVNLFGNSRCKDQILQQFAVNGIQLPPNSPFLNKGHWEIKMR